MRTNQFYCHFIKFNGASYNLIKGGLIMTKMNFIDKLELFTQRFQGNIYIQAISQGMMGIMPITLIGGVFAIVSSLPIPTVLAKALSLLALMTSSLISIYVVAAISGAYAKLKNQDANNTMILSVLMFFLITPITKDVEGVIAISTKYLGNKGMFLAIIVGIIAPMLYFFFLEKNILKFNLPDSVPPAITKMFNSLVPYLVVGLIFVIINITFSLSSFGNAHDLVYTLLQAPLNNLGNSIWSAFILVMLAEFLWFFGIHGSMVTNIFLTALFAPQAAANLEALALGQAIPYVVSSSFIGAFKGPRALALAFVLIYFAKSKHFKSVGKLAIVPSLFTISEPMKFGIPMILNLYLLIPMSLAPVVSLAIAYLANIIGFMPRVAANVIQIVPPILSGFMAAGWQGAVVQIIQFIAIVFLYLPFIKRLDKIEVKKESGSIV